LEGRFERPTTQVCKYGLDRVRGKTKDIESVEETVDPYSIRGLSHIEENRTCKSLLVKVPGYSFYKTGELQRSAVFGSEPKLLISQ